MVRFLEKKIIIQRWRFYNIMKIIISNPYASIRQYDTSGTVFVRD